VILQILEETVAAQMKINPYCQRHNCSPLNVLFSDRYCLVFRCQGSTITKQRRNGISTSKRENILQILSNTATVTINHQWEVDW